MECITDFKLYADYNNNTDRDADIRGFGYHYTDLYSDHFPHAVYTVNQPGHGKQRFDGMVTMATV